MNKKTFPLLLMVFALVSCGTQISKELEDYLLNMNYQKVYDDTNNGLVKSTYDEYNNDLLVGTHYQEKEFGRRLLDTRMIYTISIRDDYTGNKIENTIKNNYLTISFDGEKNSYFKSIDINGAITESLISDADAFNAYKTIFYLYDSPYKGGGIYYGDYCAVKSKNFDGSYKINNDGSLTYKSHDDASYAGSVIEEEFTINKYGLMLAVNEKMSVVGTSNYATQLVETKYNY